MASRAYGAAGERRLPAAIVVPRGLFLKPPPGPKPTTAAAPAPTPVRVFAGSMLPTRPDVMRRILDRFGEAAVVSTTGYASRELASYDSVRHFPMQGSMGFALGIGLGLTRAAPKGPVVVIDGDGALIMRLGSLATAGHLSPAGLVHFVLDNGAYSSTGGQATVSPNVVFAAIALACGYPRAASCRGEESLDQALEFAHAADSTGPVLVRIMISLEEPEPRERPAVAPPDIALRFRDAQKRA